MRGKTEGLKPHTGTISGTPQCGITTGPFPEMAMIYEGQTIDIVTKVSSWKKCNDVCKQNTKCLYWSWDAGNSGICSLKTSDIGRKSTSATVISGRRGSKEEGTN